MEIETGDEAENSTERTAAARTGTGDGGQGDLAAAVTSREDRWNLALIPC
jgi:hypothetical protein